MDTPENRDGDQEEKTESHGLPHWTEPGTGQTSAISRDQSESSETWTSLSDGPQWADVPETTGENPVTKAPPRVDVTIGESSKSEDFFSYDKTSDLAETTESFIS